MWVCWGIWWALENEQVNQALRGREYGSGERRKGITTLSAFAEVCGILSVILVYTFASKRARPCD